MFKIANLKEFNAKLKERLDDGARKNVRRAVFKGTNLVRNTAVESIKSGNKSGRVYKRGSVTHVASAPGQAPAADTGFLDSQITTEVKVQDNKVIGQIIASAPYAKHLEFGTSNILPRPFMQPALQKNKKKIVEIFKREGVVK
tara:strand:+ start:252 stop:680 length:429 start_codon:yes stop_codon:yes gene_type:complete